MKKLLVVLLSLTLIFAFTGCTSSNNEATSALRKKDKELLSFDDRMWNSLSDTEILPAIFRRWHWPNT